MKNRNALLFAVAAATLLLAACGSEQNKPTAPANAGVASPADAPKTALEARHPEEVKKFQGELAIILDPNVRTYGPKWKADLQGENMEPCEIRAKYTQLVAFLDRIASAKIEPKEVSDRDLRDEMRARAINYVKSVVAAVKSGDVPSCLLGQLDTFAGNCTLTTLIDDITLVIEHEKFVPEDAGTTGKELRALYLGAVRKEVPELLKEFRENRSDPEKRYRSLSRLVDLVQQHHFTAAELGLPAADYKTVAETVGYGEGNLLLPGEKEPERRE
ncbi:MAG: hypothetical protein ABSC29_04375 [Minisyncoccia bacterium]|jgi:hypothetical protein